RSRDRPGDRYLPPLAVGRRTEEEQRCRHPRGAGVSRLPFDEPPKVPIVPEVPAGSKGIVRGVVPKVPSAVVPETAGTVARPVLTVSELNAKIRDLLEYEMSTVWVEGEISNGRVWNTGRMYFTLKDGASARRAVTLRP